jgi:pimeloyl-ACP methyl ester carboxylesterase
VTTAPSLVRFRERAGTAAVVFLHGFRGDAAKTWGDFPTSMVDDARLASWDVFGLGYPTTLRVDVPGVFTANPDLSKLSFELRTRLSLPPLADYGSIAIIAHSMGGLIAQHALLDRALANRVGHLVLFGTPSGGLRKAVPLSLVLRQARDMAVGSVFLSALRTDWDTRYRIMRPFLLRVVAGDRDEFVPATSSLGPFPDDVRRVVPGNHLQIVDLSSADHPSAILVIDALTGLAQARGAVDSALVAVELRRFQQAIATLLPRVATIDDAALVQLALALDGVGRGDEALTLLEQRLRGGTTSTDAMGVLAGRLKRRWLTDREKNDWIRARALYEKALEQANAVGNAEQAMYHAINLAFLELMMVPEADAVPQIAIEMARRALDYAASAKTDHWRYATEGEAQLVLGDLAAADGKYREALRQQPGARAADSMYLQAIRVASRVFGEAGQRDLEAVFGVS